MTQIFFYDAIRQKDENLKTQIDKIYGKAQQKYYNNTLFEIIQLFCEKYIQKKRFFQNIFVTVPKQFVANYRPFSAKKKFCDESSPQFVAASRI